MAISAWVAPIHVAIASGAVLLVSLPVTAQITPDNTLGSESSRVTGGVQVRGAVGDRIDGGATRGPNVFHSFSEFNVNDGQRVYFSNPTGIENILSRVTGSNVSDILGTLGVDGDANLFLLNPNGIVFGPNAQLDVRGSFVASTANSFTFADGSQFSASDPQTAPLLTMNVPVGLQYGAPQGNLTNQADLAVEADQSLTLHGATVLHEGGLTAPGGRVQVLGDRIALLDNSRIDVSAQGGGGLVQLGGDYQGQGTLPTALRTYVAPTATINADAIGSGNGGQVIVWADETTAFNGTINARGGAEGGNGGFAEVSGLQNLLFQGRADLSASNGVVGTLLLDPTNIFIVAGAGSADDAEITDAIINADESPPFDFTISEAALENLAGGANVVLQATNDITIADLPDDSLTFAAPPTGIVPGAIVFTANADNQGGGNFSMSLGDTIRTNGRPITISGVDLNLGLIDTTPPTTVPVTTIVDIDAGGVIGAVSDEIQTSSFTLTVPATAPVATISDVNVVFSASHTWDGDLSVTLLSPDGRTLELFNAVGGDGDNFQDTVLDDSAPISIADGTVVAPFNGSSYQPTGAGGLAIFNGNTLTPNSQWILNIADTFPQADSGQLYQAGDATPWGTPAGGTQLVVSTSVANIASGGSITLTGAGDVSAQQLNASSFSLSGGAVTVRAGGNITVSGIDTSGFNGSGGAVRLTSGAQELRGVDDPAPGDINVQQISTFGGDGNGGLVSLDARGAINITGVDASSAVDQGGNIRLNAGGALTLEGGFVGNTSNNLNLGLATISLTSTTGAVTIRDAWLDASNYFPGNSGNTGQEGIVITTPTNVVIERSSLYASGAGTIDVQAGERVTTNDSFFSTERYDPYLTTDDNRPINGAITFRTTAPNGQLLLTNTSLTSSTYGADDSGNISLHSNRINLVGSEVRTNSVAPFLLDESLVTGNVGSISIDGFLTMDNSVLNSSTEGSGQGGDITINGPLTMVNRSSINANTVGTNGVGGNINITAAGTAVSLNNSQINLETLRNAQAGALTIRAGAVSLTNQARINAAVQSSGTGGSITITTTNPYIPETGAFPIEMDNSLISTAVESTGTGAGGNVTVNSAAIALRNGARIEAATRGPGNAGRIRLRASDRVDISGVGPTGLFSGITTASQSVTSGTGGAIIVDVRNDAGTGTLQLSDRAFLSSGTASENSGGNIRIDVDRLSIQRGGQIIASTTGPGDAGLITINATRGVNLSGQGRPINVSQLDAFSGINFLTLTEGEIAQDFQTPVLNNPFYASNSRLATQGEGFDYYTFSVTQAGSQGIFDMDTADFDTELFLFDRATGALLASNDDGYANEILEDVNDTDSFLDSYIDYTFAAPGSYVLGVGQFDSEVAGTRVDGAPIPERGNYTLRVSLENQGNVAFNVDNLNNPNNGLSSGLLAEASNTGAAGRIAITTPVLTVSNTARVSTTTSLATVGAGRGGNISVATNSLTLQGTDSLDNGVDADSSTGLLAQSTGRGTAGTITVRAIEDDAPLSVSLSGASQISASTTGLGRGGNIALLQASTLDLSEQSQISASSTRNRAGDVSIQMQRGGDITLSNSQISSASSRGGEAGSVSITDADRLTLNNSILTVRNTGQSTVENATNLTVEARQARLFNGSTLIAESTVGRGGNVTLEIDDELSLDGASTISASTVEGQGGTLNLTAERVSLNGASAITAGPTGRTGRGGDLNLEIQDELSLDGGSRLESRATNGGTAGNIVLTSDWLRVRNDSEISVSSPQGIAGNLTINTSRLRMDNGRLTALAGQGDNGSIAINVLADSNALIELYDRSIISAESNGSADGGDVTIRIPNGFVVSTLEDNSDIIARANGEGSGGDIFIRTLSIFGLRTGDRLTRFSDINASSEFGPTGTIVLSTLGIDPTRGLSELPNTIVDATSLVARSCPTQLEASDALGFFIITGRGGLPQTPGDMMSESVLLPGLISLNSSENEADIQATEADSNAAPATIVEAQGWVVGPDGNVILTAQEPGENALPGVRSLTCEDGV